MPEAASTLLFGLDHLIVGYFALLNTTYLVFWMIAFGALIAHRRSNREENLLFLLAETAYKPISILVPAHNEGPTIAASVRSLLTLSYPEFEVVVVNDGSKDDTLEVLRHAFDLVPVPAAFAERLPARPVRTVYRSLDHPNLLVLDKEQGGKSDALNAAINAANFPLFCCIDADSLLEPDAILRVSRVFADDPAAVAVGGIVRVLNGSVVQDGRVVAVRAPGRPMVLCQVLEYIRGFLAGRTALSRINGLLIISGAFGLFRKEAVIAAGGYSRQTVCEDMEVVVRLHREARGRRQRQRVIFVPDPVCWTQVPEDWRSLLRQRDRWQRGLIESLWLHRRMLLNPRYGVVGMFAFPFYVLFEAFGPLLETLGYLVVPVAWYLGLLQREFALLFFFLAVVYGILITLLALVLDDLVFRRYERPSDLLRLLLASVLEYLGFRQLLAFRRAVSFITVFHSQAWGHPDRVAIAHREKTAPGAPP
jgi:cellulose synthase/poly-beta-1,6-N-acetylglucosamine synthase-like glycosyltransferase